SLMPPQKIIYSSLHLPTRVFPMLAPTTGSFNVKTLTYLMQAGALLIGACATSLALLSIERGWFVLFAVNAVLLGANLFIFFAQFVIRDRLNRRQEMKRWIATPIEKEARP